MEFPTDGYHVALDMDDSGRICGAYLRYWDGVPHTDENGNLYMTKLKCIVKRFDSITAIAEYIYELHGVSK